MPRILVAQGRKGPLFSEEQVSLIESRVKQSPGTMAFPTETFYGLGCRADSSSAVSKVFMLKKRDPSLPLLVLVDGWEMLFGQVEEMSGDCVSFLRKYWPGPLTVVLASQNKLAPELNPKGPKLGFRMTSSEHCRELIRILKTPLVGTSANLSGEPEKTSMAEVHQSFGDGIDLYIDGGKTPGGKPSTLIEAVDSESFRLLRRGSIDLGKEPAGGLYRFTDF